MSKSKINRDYIVNGKVVMTFASDYNRTLEQFKKDFQDNHVFANMHPDVREEALKEAHQIATNGNVRAVPQEGNSSK